MNELKVCKKCGWHALLNHERDECDPKAGAAADTLMKSLPDVKSTKLGYGFGRVTFEFSERASVTFEVYPDGFRIDRVHLLDNFTQTEASEFIRSLTTRLPTSR